MPTNYYLTKMAIIADLISTSRQVIMEVKRLEKPAFVDNLNYGTNFFFKFYFFRNGYKNLIMVGDGATDAEACPPADAFIGFGGNQVILLYLK